MTADFTFEGRFPSLNEYVTTERGNRIAAARMKRRETEYAAAVVA